MKSKGGNRVTLLGDLNEKDKRRRENTGEEADQLAGTENKTQMIVYF